MTNTYCSCPQTTKYFLHFVKSFSTKVENSYFQDKGTNTAHQSAGSFYQSHECIWTPVDWKDISLMSTEQRLSDEGKFCSILSHTLKTECKDKPASLENQTKPNQTPKPHMF